MDDKKKNPQFKDKVGAYKKTHVVTASRENMLLMLYEGAIRFLKQAIAASKEENLSEKARLIGRTMDIIGEFRATLNHKANGEIAEKLESLYDFIQRRLIVASGEKDFKAAVIPMEEALSVLNTLYSGWVEAIGNLKKDPPLTTKPTQG